MIEVSQVRNADCEVLSRFEEFFREALNAAEKAGHGLERIVLFRSVQVLFAFSVLYCSRICLSAYHIFSGITFYSQLRSKLLWQ